MSASTQFTFTRGTFVFIWMCDQQAEQRNCFDESLRNDEEPSDIVLNCREGVYELKCWALRLLDQQYPEEDEMADEDEDLTEDELHYRTLGKISFSDRRYIELIKDRRAARSTSEAAVVGTVCTRTTSCRQKKS